MWISVCSNSNNHKILFLILLVCCFGLVLSQQVKYTISTIAGGGTSTADNVQATQALIGATGVFYHESTGEIYFADKSYHKIRKITTAKNVVTVAGTGVKGFSSDGGSALNAKLNSPADVTVDLVGNIYFTEYDSHTIRKVSKSSGNISTIAGTPNTSGAAGDGQLATSATLFRPNNLALVGSDIFFSDYMNYKVRKIDGSTGIITTVAGTGSYGFTGDGGLATSAQFIYPIQIFALNSNKIYIIDDGNNRVRLLSNNLLTSIVGSGNTNYYPTSSGDGGPQLSCVLARPKGVWVSAVNGDIIVSEAYRIRKVSNGNITTIAGNGGNTNLGDGLLATLANLGGGSLTVYKGKVYFADTTFNRIRMLDPYCDNGYVFNGTLEACVAGCYGLSGSDACGGPSQGTCSSPGQCSCVNSYKGSDCSDFDCYGVNRLDSTVCSNGRGQCKGPDSCVCNNGYFGKSCELTTCFGIVSNDSNVCSKPRGSCDSFNVCNCQSQYYGANCSLTTCFGKASNDSSTCSSQGICKDYNTCQCNANYGGSDCSSTTCYGISNSDKNVCSSSGKCSSYNKCDCQTGYYGSQCEMFDCNGIAKTSDKVCSGNGICKDVNKCSCNQTWYGENCNITNCYGTSSNDTTVCSGNGGCQSFNNCTCQNGYVGSTCGIFNCSSSVSNVCLNGGYCGSDHLCNCTNDFSGDHCQIPNCFGILANNSNVCSGHGKCLDRNKCSCNSEWFGVKCNTTRCNFIFSNTSNVCSGNGDCVAPDTCNCKYGYTDTNCQTAICFGKTLSLACSKRGSCISPDTCSCYNGYEGKECEQYVALLDSKGETLSMIDTSLSYTISSFDGTCQSVFGSGTSLNKLGVDPTCILTSSVLKVILGYNQQLVHGDLLYLTGQNVVIFIDTSLAKTFSLNLQSDGVKFYLKFPKSISKNSNLIVKPSIDPFYQLFKPTSISWMSNIDTINNYLQSYSQDVLILPSSLLDGLNSLKLNVTVKNHANSVKNDTIDIAIQDSSSTKNYLSFGMDFTNEFECKGYNCILEIEGRSDETISFQVNSIVTDIGSTRSFVRLSSLSDSDGLIALYNGNVKISISTTDVLLPISFTSVDLQNFHIALQGVGAIYPSQSSITFKVLTYSIQQFTSYSWKVYKIKNNTISSDLVQEDITFKKVFTIAPNKLSEGVYMLVVTVSTIKGTSSINGTFSVSSTIVPSIILDVLPYESGVSAVQDLSLGATILTRGLTNLTPRWNLIEGRLKNSIVKFFAGTTQTITANQVRSTLVLSSSKLLEGERYSFNVTVQDTSSNVLSYAIMSFTTAVTPKLYCSFNTTGSSIAFESYMTISCITTSDNQKSALVKITILNSNKKRIFVLSSSLKKRMVSRIPYIPNGFSIQVTLVSEMGSSGVYTQQFTSTVSTTFTEPSMIQYVSRLYKDEVNSKRVGSMNLLNSITSLVSIVEGNNLGSSTQDLSLLNSTLIDMHSSLKYIRDTIGYGVDDMITALMLPNINRIFKTLVVLNSSESQKVLIRNYISEWTTWFIEKFKVYLALQQEQTIQSLFDCQHVEELLNLINLENSLSTDLPNTKTEIGAQLFASKICPSMDISTLLSSTGGVGSELFRGEFNSRLIQTGFNGITIQTPIDFSSQISFSDENVYSIQFAYRPVIKQEKGIIGMSISITNTDTLDIVDVQGLSTNLMTINFPTVSNPSRNISCQYWNENKWSTTGVSTVVTPLTQSTYSVSCLTSHLTTFALFDYTLTQQPVNSTNRIVPDTKQSDVGGIIAIAVIVPLVVIALIVIILVVIAVIIVKQQRKKKQYSKQRLQGERNIDIELSSSTFDKHHMPRNVTQLPSDSSTSLTNPSSHFPSTMPSMIPIPIKNTSQFDYRFKDARKIGEGGFGSVFVATEISTNQELAIKKLRYGDSFELSEFLKEGLKLSNIKHPNIIKIHDLFVDEGEICMVMDFYPNGDLCQLLKSKKVISEPILKKIVYQVCNALLYVHTELNLIHRDIKPNNILIKSIDLVHQDIEVVLADFGVAVDSNENMHTSNVGTSSFMAPEVKMGSKYRENADIYSLGVTLYQLMTMDRSTTIQEKICVLDAADYVKLLRTKLEPTTHVYSMELVEVCIAMLEKNFEIRPNAQQVLDLPYFKTSSMMIAN